jgi:hypothetical protein
MLQKFFRNKSISKKLKLRLKNTITDQNLTFASEPWILTERDRKQINIFERKVYRRILGPVYDNEKEKWTIKKFMQWLKPHYNRDNKVKWITLVWACTENRRKWNSEKSIIYEF